MRTNKQMSLFEYKTEKNKKFEEKIGFIDTLNLKLSSKKNLNVVSLFSGCGGMDFGFLGDFNIFSSEYEKNPFNIVLANDIDKYACETYRENFDHLVVHDDLKNINLLNYELQDTDIVIGGFPCQDFSHAGNREGTNTKRGRLYKEMKKVVNELKPKAFVAENVDGLRTIRNSNKESTLSQIIKEFVEIGYNVEYQVLNAVDYGVPQNRVRIFIIGVRNDLAKKIYYPLPTHFENSEKNPWRTSYDGIDDLWNKLDDPSINKHSSKDYSKAKFYPGRKMQGNRKIEANKPSMTIRAEHHGNIEGHYKTNNPENPEDMLGWRRLSVRECARLQSFPDNFIFPCSTSQAYRQIGNAVPPILGWHIARSLYYTLCY